MIPCTSVLHKKQDLLRHLPTLPKICKWLSVNSYSGYASHEQLRPSTYQTMKNLRKQ